MAEFTPQDGVIYLTVGSKHLVHIVVSLMTLREHYKGPIAVLSGDDNFEKHALDDRWGDLEVIRFEYQNTNPYHAKTSMYELSPFERTVFLDADTIVVGKFSELLPETDEEVKFTQFADWTTHHPERRGKRRISGRISGNGWPELLPTQVAYQLEHPYPAINTGTLGFSRGSHRFMKRWKDVTTKQFELSRQREDVSAFISDEIAAQLLAFEYPHRVLDSRWNASPVYWPGGWWSAQDVRIWHGHGSKFFKCRDLVEGAKRQNGIWLPHFFRAMRDGLANIDKWHHKLRSRKRPSLHVQGLEKKYQHWLEHGEIPLEA